MDERMRSGRKTVLEGRRLAEMKLMIDQNLCLPITSFRLCENEKRDTQKLSLRAKNLLKTAFSHSLILTE